LTFHPTRRLAALDVEEVLATVELRINRLLDRRGLGERDDDGGADAWAQDAPRWRALLRRPCKGPWRSGLSAALGCVDWVTRPMRATVRPREAVMRERTASICTRGSWCQRDSGIGSSGCVAMR
jgi:hypothetical protein